MRNEENGSSLLQFCSGDDTAAHVFDFDSEVNVGVDEDFHRLAPLEEGGALFRGFDGVVAENFRHGEFFVGFGGC